MKVASIHVLDANRPSWSWPLDLEAYNRSPVLTEAEREQIAYIAARTGNRSKVGGTGGTWPEKSRKTLERLLSPVVDACNLLGRGKTAGTIRQRQQSVIRAIIIEIDRRQKAYWGWTEAEWFDFIQPSLEAFNNRVGWQWTADSKSSSGTRTRIAAIGYLFGGIADPRKACEFKRIELAEIMFGKTLVADAIERIRAVLRPLGYSPYEVDKIATPICEMLLVNKSPFLEDLTVAVTQRIYDNTLPSMQNEIGLATRALAKLGVIEQEIPEKRTGPARGYLQANETCDPNWIEWCDAWYGMSTLAHKTKDTFYRVLLMTGRWLKETHSLVVSPEQWDIGLATEFVASLCNWRVGQYTLIPVLSEKYRKSVGKPLVARTVNGYLSAIRTFFIDLQLSEKIPLRFSPQRYLQTPRSVLRKIRPNPRVIEKGIWAKLVWAGQNIEENDLPSNMYPLEMVRAIAAAWLFTALRSDEIARLTVGCIEWPQADIHDIDTGKVISVDAVCYLHVPVNKTTGAFKKPVSPYVGKMIEAWIAVRPAQPLQLDQKSAEMVEYLFSVRGKNISNDYINNTLIPMLCKKAGLDLKDQRGPITSHRARATIATYLGNSENPMTLIQLMKWLGHQNPDSTRNYVQADISKMAVKVAEGSFFQQNLASVPVIIDTDAIRNGAAANGEPWKYFDLGHGLCKLSEWSSCKHRMACAKCDYFEPKDSMKVQLLEANGNLSKMLEFVTLGEDERKLVEQGLNINHELLSRLQTVPTPSGPTPEQLQHSVEASEVTTTIHLVRNESG